MTILGPATTNYLFNISTTSTNVFDVGSTLYNYYTNVLCLLGGGGGGFGENNSPSESVAWKHESEADSCEIQGVGVGRVPFKSRQKHNWIR